MKQEDNINNFFRKNLTDHTPAEDAWNVPSDDIWNKAKAEFPKKKDRRPFFYLVFFSAIIGLLFSSLYLNLKTDQEQNPPVTKEAIVISEEERTSTKENVNKENLTPSDQDHLDLSSNNNEGLKNNTTQRKEKIATTTFIKPLLQANKEQQQNDFKQISTEEVALSKSNRTSQSGASSTILGNGTETISMQRSSNSEQFSPIAGKVEEANNSKLLKNAKELETRANFDLDNLAATQMQLEGTEVCDLPEAFIPIKPLRTRHRWEIGLTAAPFIISIDGLFDTTSEDEENEEVDLKISDWSVNVPISRRLNRSFSLSSGVYLSKLGIDLGFSAKEVYDANDTDTDLRALLRKGSSVGSLSLNDVSSDLGVEFVDNANLMTGDTVLVKGLIPIFVNAIQIPLMLNYHFGKGKFEGLLHAGVAVDYFHSGINSVDFKVYKEGNLISKPVEFEAIKDGSFDFGIYAGFGMKYHLNNTFNIGLSTKIDINRVPLSRYEVGIYYGF